MGQVAGIIGSILGSTNNAGNDSSVLQNAASQISKLSDAGSQKPDIKTANVEKAADTGTTPTETTPKANESSGTNWEELAKNAKSLLDSSSSNQQPQQVQANQTSQPQQLANFR